MNETIQSQQISAQHPAVVLRSNYQHLRTLLAVMLIAVIGLTVAVVVLATRNTSTSASSRVSSSVKASTWRPGTTRFDGGPEEGQLYISHGNAGGGSSSPPLMNMGGYSGDQFTSGRGNR